MTNIKYKLIENDAIEFPERNNFIIYSFYTNDHYYKEKYTLLSKQLIKLRLPHQIDELIIDKSQCNWADICRKKLLFINNICKKYPTKKIFWIDIDCFLSHFPKNIENFSADIIGFYRGFASPLKMGYHIKSRFWEPCFLGFNTTSVARNFIDLSVRLEQSFNGAATDDYFLEEAWRQSCEIINFQIIPSSERIIDKKTNGFFITGSSGNVSQFAEKVAHHTPLYESSSAKIRRMIRSIKRKLRSLNYGK